MSVKDECYSNIKSKIRIFKKENNMLNQGIAGLMVEFHLAKVGVRVRFPGDAFFFFSSFIVSTKLFYVKISCQNDYFWDC